MNVTTANIHDEPQHSSKIGLSLSQMGMLTFLASEVAFFSTLIVAFLTLVGRDTVGPFPHEVLNLPMAIVSSIFLLSSSGTIMVAEKRLHQGNLRGFRMWWALTIVLGAVFLTGTAWEWYEMIVKHDLTISRNLFGTAYYTLVGFHAVHVTCGLIAMLVILRLAKDYVHQPQEGGGVQIVSWYWHFVDGVWVVVFCIVYLWGRSA